MIENTEEPIRELSHIRRKMETPMAAAETQEPIGTLPTNENSNQDLQQRFENCEKCGSSYLSKFPEVRVISAIDADKLSDTEIVLVDVRSKKEQDISMIQGAITQEEFERRLNGGEIPPNSIIAPYCTVGYRSGKYAQSLIQEKNLSEDRVRNHQGILMYTYLNKPLVKPSNQEDGLFKTANTLDVHVYAYPWSGYSHPKYREVYTGQGCLVV